METATVNDKDGAQPAQSTSDPAPEPMPDRTPHEMRIASQGKLRTYVAFALKFLQESHERPLVLHTLPYKPPPSLNDDVTHDKAVDPPTTGVIPTPATAAAGPSAPPPNPPPEQPERTGLPSACAAIPRLISVVEIIKREWVELVSNADGSLPLYQYNELGSLEELDGKEGVAAEQKLELLELLQGKNHLQIRRTPYMKVTLSKQLLGDGWEKSTYQDPLPGKKRSKSAKARARKKRKKEEAALTASATGRSSAKGTEPGPAEGTRYDEGDFDDDGS